MKPSTFGNYCSGSFSADWKNVIVPGLFEGRAPDWNTMHLCIRGHRPRQLKNITVAGGKVTGDPIRVPLKPGKYTGNLTVRLGRRRVSIINYFFECDVDFVFQVPTDEGFLFSI